MRGSVSDNVYLTAGREKIAQYKEGHTARLPGMLLPKKESFPRSLQKPFFVSPAAPFTLLRTGHKKSAQKVQVQLNTTFNPQPPKEGRRSTAMDTSRAGDSDQDLPLL